MGRHNSSKSARGMPVFQIVVELFNKKDGYHRRESKLSLISGRKAIDILPSIPQRTLLGHFKDSEAAKSWGRRFGSLVSCGKVDPFYWTRNIEYLTIEEKPITVELAKEEQYILSKTLELTRPRKQARDTYDVEIIDDTSIDKDTKV